MKFRRIIALVCAVSCLLSLASCKKKNNPAQTTDTSETTAATSLDLSISLPEGWEEMTPEEILDAYKGMYSEETDFGVVAGSVDSLMALGFETEADMNANLRPGEVTPEFPVTRAEKTLMVTVTNPYDADCTVGEGIVSSCSVENAGDILPGVIDGETTAEQIVDLMGQPYAQTEESIVYKVFGGKTWEIDPLGQLYTGFSVDSMKNWELVFGLAGGVLSSVRFLVPSLMYGGVEDNVSPEKVDEITYEEQVTVVEIKNSILEKLTSEFAAAEIAVVVDPQSGEIVFADDILFGNESYALSDEGKAYLDKVFAVYASVLLGDEYCDKVSAIVFEGHTNTLGTFDYNQDLSEKRAKAVYDHCFASTENGMTAEQKAQLENIAQTKGYSYTDPVYTAEGDVDMEASRRVALKFYVTVE